MRALRKFDRVKGTLLEELPDGALFRFRNNIYQKGKQLRKRFLCREVNSNRILLFQPITPVSKV